MLSRRNLLIGLGVGAVVVAASPLKTVVVGHTKDAVSRIGPGEELAAGKVTHTGTFRSDDPGQDALHRLWGSAQIVERDGTYYLQLNDDFNSTPGPDYHVYVSPSLDIVDERTFKGTSQIEVGRLKRGKGTQEYNLGDLELEDNLSVTIWCKRFGEFIGSANLKGK